MRPITFPALLLLMAAGSPAVAQSNDPQLAEIVAAPSRQRLEADLRTLVAFGTRHTLSDTLSPTRGIGAARRWIHAEFTRISQACGGCLEVRYLPQRFGPQRRVPVATNVVSVIAIQRGTGDTGRVAMMTAHFDSRNSDTNDISRDAPGANDDGSGTVAVIEAARILSRHRFQGTIVYAALAGEEQSLLGGQAVAAFARRSGWRVFNLNNDIVGNTRGGTGQRDTMMVRLFSDAVPPGETDVQRRRRRSAGGEVDGISRQLARYVQMIARRHLPQLDPWVIYRLDRFNRGGDHSALSDSGYAAIRITEPYEDYTRQHQDVRTENGVRYGDLLDGVDFGYVARITALNAAALASLSWAPAPPRNVRLGGRYDAELRWLAPEDSSHVASYRVYWRRTDSPAWDHVEDVGRVSGYTLTGRIIDNYYFGVASVSREGHESVVVFPSGN